MSIVALIRQLHVSLAQVRESKSSEPLGLSSEAVETDGGDVLSEPELAHELETPQSSRRRRLRKDAAQINRQRLLEREAQRRQGVSQARSQPPPLQVREPEVRPSECPICLEQVTEFVTWRGTDMCATCKKSLSADDPTLIRPKNRER
jgi:hypothetical protein